jgi:hypothetical protein
VGKLLFHWVQNLVPAFISFIPWHAMKVNSAADC